MLTHLGVGNLDVVGLSQGGMIALELALRYWRITRTVANRPLFGSPNSTFNVRNVGVCCLSAPLLKTA